MRLGKRSEMRSDLRQRWKGGSKNQGTEKISSLKMKEKHMRKTDLRYDSESLMQRQST